MTEDVEERKAVAEDEPDKDKGRRKGRLIELIWSQIAV